MWLRTVLVVASLASTTASAAQFTCPTEAQRTELHAFSDRLARADSPEAARALALRKLALGHRAIDAAARVVHDPAGIAEAAARLDALEADVRGAQTQREVAESFDRRATAVNCNYDTVEIVIIVIGFVLGILPGILFLFLFC